MLIKSKNSARPGFRTVITLFQKYTVSIGYIIKKHFGLFFCANVFLFGLFASDVYHNIEALDPEKLNVFRTVREVTGKMCQLSIS